MAPNMQGPYYVRGSALGSSHCRIDLIRSNSQFYLNIPLSDVQNTPLGVEFFRLAEEFHALERHDMEAYHRPINLICSHFLPLFEKLAPPISINNLTLEDYVHAPTYHLVVVWYEEWRSGCQRSRDTSFHASLLYRAPSHAIRPRVLEDHPSDTGE